MAVFYHVDKDRYPHEPGAQILLMLPTSDQLSALNEQDRTYWKARFNSQGFSFFGFRMLSIINWPPHGLSEQDRVAIRREIIFEDVREQHFPDKPSRFQSLFAFKSLTEAEDYRRKSRHPEWPIWIVESADFFVGDIELYGSADPSDFREIAERYWAGERSENPTEEVLLRFPVRVVGKPEAMAWHRQAPSPLYLEPADRRKLTFVGEIRSNKGKFSDMEIPGRADLLHAPEDWPTRVFPGSLNIGVPEDGFPKEFHALGKKEGMQKLDECNFPPAFVIPHADIRNNSLAKKGNKLRGNAQVWRATVKVVATKRSLDCWALRRVGSTIKRQVELVSERHLKTALEVQDGDIVMVTVLEGVGGG